jgi:hypothetical protein
MRRHRTDATARGDKEDAAEERNDAHGAACGKPADPQVGWWSFDLLRGPVAGAGHDHRIALFLRMRNGRETMPFCERRR